MQLKNTVLPLLATSVLATSSCSVFQPKSTAVIEKNENLADSKRLTATLSPVRDAYKLGNSIELKFAVHNNNAEAVEFTQYHTPFEGMMDKYLTITDASGNEIAYHGPMTRRIMPPPADTYHKVAPNKTKSVTFSIDKGYTITKAGTYTITYGAEGVNGLISNESIEIQVVE